MTDILEKILHIAFAVSVLLSVIYFGSEGFLRIRYRTIHWKSLESRFDVGVGTFLLTSFNVFWCKERIAIPDFRNLTLENRRKVIHAIILSRNAYRLSGYQLSKYLLNKIMTNPGISIYSTNNYPGRPGFPAQPHPLQKLRPTDQKASEGQNGPIGTQAPSTKDRDEKDEEKPPQPPPASK